MNFADLKDALSHCFILAVMYYSSMLRHGSSVICTNPKSSNYSARIWFNLCRTGSLTNLDDLNIVRPIKSDKISHMTIIVLFFGNTV